MQRRDLLLGGAGLAALAIGSTARAQVLPGNAFIISGFPPGGMGDYVARPLADKLRGKYAANVLVDTKVGAGGRIAAEYVRRAAPDGLTILQIPSGVMTLYPHTYRKLTYDPLADFIPVTSTVSYQFVLTAGPGLPAEIRTVADFLAWARANPRQASYGVPAAGSALHFAGMMLHKDSGVPLTSVAYRGGAPLLADVLGGQVPVSFNVLGEVLPYIRAGKLRGLAVTSAQRSPFLPDVPTLAEAGYKDIVVQEYLGWFLPARTPPDIVNRLNAQVREALQAPEYIKALAENGLVPSHQSPEEFARIVRGDHQRWGPIVKASGFTAEDEVALQLTGAQALVRTLLAEQVRHVYGIVGGKLAPLLHAIAQEPRVRFLGVRHEASGAIMAAANHAAGGGIAVALGEMGPGGINLASGLGVAYGNNLPLLAITTNQHRAAAYPHAGMFMDLDTLALTKPLTKWNAAVHDARRIPELARRAFREALGGRPGPVHLDVAQDVLAQKADFADDEFALEPQRYRALQGPRPAAEAVAEAVVLLRTARRPLIVAGGGVVAAGATEAVRSLAQLLKAPVVPTQMALGVVASDSPHFIGHGGLIAGEAVRSAFERADVIVSVGCRWSSWLWDEQGAFARRGHRTIAINIDPSALGSAAVHTVALQADARQALNDLLQACDSGVARQVETDWLASVRATRAAYEAKLDELAAHRGDVMHPAALARAIAEALPANALAVYDGGHTSFWSNDYTPVHGVRTRFHDPGMCQLGFGLPYALALQAQQPGRPVVNITGDGSFGFTLAELDTARRYRLPVLNIVHNNAAWGIIRAGQRNALDFEMGTSLEGSDYAAIARGFGCHGETVTAPQQVGAAIERARDSGLPAVLDCRTCFVAHPAAPMFGSMNRYGFDALTRTGPAGH